MARATNKHGTVRMTAWKESQRPVARPKLRRARKARGWSEADVAVKLYNLGVDDGLDEDELGVDARTVSGWELHPRRPKQHYVALLSRLFECAPEELDLPRVVLPHLPMSIEPPSGSSVAEGAPPTDQAQYDAEEMRRRQFMAMMSVGAGLLMTGSWEVDPDLRSSWERLAHALGERSTVDRPTVDGLERVTVALERMEQEVGPHDLIGALSGHVDAMTRLLQRPMPSSLRPQLASIAAESAGMLAMVRAQTGDAAKSATDAQTALLLSHEAGDSALGAWVMGCYTATHPAYRNQPELRLRHFTEGAFGFDPRGASQRSSAWFAAKAADVYAQLGRADESLRSLEQMDRLYQRSHADSDERPRHQLLGDDRFWLAAERGACLARLGQSQAARAALDVALRQGGSDFRHVSLWLLLAKARTYAHDGEIEQACKLAADVALRARQHDFVALIRELHRMHSVELATWAATATVRDLAQQLENQ